MFTLSSKVIYSISALFELSLSYKGNSLQIKEIAASQNIPINYLEQILLLLRKAGFVQSIRGAQGGYKLIVDPANIKIIDIMEAIEGKVKLKNKDFKEEVLNTLFQYNEKHITNMFNVTLAELILKKKTLDNQTMYHI